MLMVTVGLLDSGVDRQLALHVEASRCFRLGADGKVLSEAADGDPLGHGSALARIILAGAPEARIVSAQVFPESNRTSVAVISAGLDWIAAQRVDLINMSFGLRRDRRRLAEACERALANGCTLVAAAPARGPCVYPSSYPGVLKITGDARCAPGEISHLGTDQAQYGACPRAMGLTDAAPMAGGASFAVAHVIGLLARYRLEGGKPSGIEAHLKNIARYHGPERRSANVAG